MGQQAGKILTGSRLGGHLGKNGYGSSSQEDDGKFMTVFTWLTMSKSAIGLGVQGKKNSSQLDIQLQGAVPQ